MTLADLARSNGLLVNLGRNGESYRYHPLFGEMLRAELRRVEPERERHVHRLASAWYASHDDDDRSIHHALAAGEVETAGDRLWTGAARHIAHGRNEAVQRRLSEFRTEQISTCAPLALVAANSRLAAGDGGGAER